MVFSNLFKDMMFYVTPKVSIDIKLLKNGVSAAGGQKERHREASQHAKPDTIKRMQFTSSLDHLSPVAANVAVSKPDLKPSAALSPDAGVRPLTNTHIETETSAGSRKRKNFGSSNEQPFLRFPSLFSSDFCPSALLYAQPSLSNTMNYGEDGYTTSSSAQPPDGIVEDPGGRQPDPPSMPLEGERGYYQPSSGRADDEMVARVHRAQLEDLQLSVQGAHARPRTSTP
ncbi:hypothetical protein BU15DRAFT_82141 [Melanogaster broomeanus]|nr:hypothetical protein BU15DRAFT_82141 [Melanogaster broomeanus]